MNNLSKSCLSVAFLCIVFLCFAQPLSAQRIDTSKVYQLDEIIISASRFKEKPSTVGRNVSVISSREIQQSIHYNVADLLAGQQSVHIIGNGQTPGSLQQGFIRNANSNHSLVLIDGVRISDPSTVNDAVDLSEISLLGVERIEIVRGSHSTLYGSSAIGGVINIITKKAGPRGFSADLSTKNGVFGSGTYSTTNNVLLNYAGKSGFYADAGITQHYTAGLDATIDTVSNASVFNPRDRDDFTKIDLLGKIGYTSAQFDVNASYRRENQSLDVDQGAFNDDDNAQTDFDRDLFSLKAGYRVSKQFELSYNGAYSDLNRLFINDSSVVNAQGDFDGTFVKTNAEGSLIENDVTGTVTGNFVKASFGVESTIQKMNFRTDIFSRSQFGVFESTTDLDSLDLKETINSAFAHVELNGGMLSSSLEPFTLTLGSRLSKHNEFGTNITYEINPKVQLSDNALVYAALTTGYNAPSLYQLNTPERTGTFTTRGNAGLDPEKSVSYELGFKQSIDNVVDVELSLFQTRTKDVIEYIYLWEGNTSIQNLGFADYLGDTYINISEQNIKGIELGLNIKPAPKFSVGGNLSLTEATLNFAPGDIDQSYTGGNHVQIFESGEFINNETELEGLTRRPSISALLRASYQLDPSVRLLVTSRFVGSRDDIFFSANLGPFGAQDRSSVSGYNLTDVNINYSVNSRLSVTGKIENLLDADYVEINGFRTKGRGFFLRIGYRFN